MTYQSDYFSKLHPKQQFDLAPEKIINYASHSETHNFRFTQWTAIQIFMALDEIFGAIHDLESATDLAYDLYTPHVIPSIRHIWADNTPQNIIDLYELAGKSPETVINFSSHKRTSTELYPIKTLLTKAASFRNWTKKINKAIAACKPVEPIVTPVQETPKTVRIPLAPDSVILYVPEKAISPVQETPKTSAQQDQEIINTVLIAAYLEDQAIETATRLDTTGAIANLYPEKLNTVCSNCNSVCPSGVLENGLCTDCDLVGKRISVHWGRFGVVSCLVERVTKRGTIYAKRWNTSKAAYTKARIVKPYKNNIYIVY